MLPLFPYDTAKVVTVCLHSKYLFTFYAKNRLFLIYINSLGQAGAWKGDSGAFARCFLSFVFLWGKHEKRQKRTSGGFSSLLIFFTFFVFGLFFLCIYGASPDKYPYFYARKIRI